MAHVDETVVEDMATCPLHRINPLDPTLNQNPHAFFRRLRDAFLGMVHVSRYDDILEVVRQPQVFSSEWGQTLGVDLLPEEAELLRDDRSRKPTLLTCDPPAHTRYKKLAIKGFAFKRVEQMAAYVDQVVSELIDGFVEVGACEFKTPFADNLPSILIADAVGVDRTMLPQWHQWLQSSVRRFDLHLLSREERIETAAT